MTQKERHRRWRKNNKAKIALWGKRWRASGSLAVRRGNWRRYGIDVAAAEAALLQHKGKCECCNTKTPGGRGGWHVDHDHKTGRVRGVLCSRCNLALGKVDSIGFKKILSYLSGNAGTADKKEAVPPANKGR